MKPISRRNLITGGIAATAGAAGITAATRLTRKYGLIPPDHAGCYGAGETLTYAAQRILTAHSMAREFPPSLISKAPFANPTAPLGDVFAQHQVEGFANWRLSISGLVERPTSFSLADLEKFPSRSHITEIACEEGWSYIAQWTGAALVDVLNAVGFKPQARYVVYYAIEKPWWESIDMADALHPQTLLSYGMNGGELPVPFGGPLRIRVPRQLGYKSVKYITHITVTDTLKNLGKGLGSASPEAGYSWYAGI
jgi:DMSO/TMAO reductase YedYZ molybdopterin-dependent catalytic subunit